MKYLSAIVLIFASSGIGVGQQRKAVRPKAPSTTQCVSNSSPSLRGFRLGQSVDEINKLIPDFALAYERQKQSSGLHFLGDTIISAGKEIGMVSMESGESGIQSEPNLRMPSGFEDVRINWQFYQDKLYAYSVYYPEYAPPTARSFVKQLVDKADFPSKGWVIPNEFYATLKCDGFKVWLGIAYRNDASVTVTDTKVESEISRREREIAQRKKRELKEQQINEKTRRETLKP